MRTLPPADVLAVECCGAPLVPYRFGWWWDTRAVAAFYVCPVCFADRGERRVLWCWTNDDATAHDAIRS